MGVWRVAGSILGNRVLRKEDPKFLTTGGVYVDDLLDEPLLAGAAHVTYVRSSVAHGVTIYLLSVLPELRRAGLDLTSCFLREPHPAAAPPRGRRPPG